MHMLHAHVHVHVTCTCTCVCNMSCACACNRNLRLSHNAAPRLPWCCACSGPCSAPRRKSYLNTQVLGRPIRFSFLRVPVRFGPLSFLFVCARTYVRCTRRATCTCTYVHVSMHVLRASRRAEIRARHREEHRVPPDRVPTNTSHTLTSCWRNQPYRGRRGRRSPRGQPVGRNDVRRANGGAVFARTQTKVFKEPGTRGPDGTRAPSVRPTTPPAAPSGQRAADVRPARSGAPTARRSCFAPVRYDDQPA
jgi:hypothetical protein